MSTIYRLTLTPKTLDNADDDGRAVLETAKAQVGFIPNMYARMVNSPGLLETYLFGYARLQAQSSLSPAELEVAFLTISRENGCQYCVAAHSMLADTRSKVPAEVTEAIREGREIPDTKLAALSAFTRTMLLTRGRPTPADVQAFFDAGYSEKDVLEIILALAVKTISNYANHLFHTPLDDMFAARAWQS